MELKVKASRRAIWYGLTFIYWLIINPCIVSAKCNKYSLQDRRENTELNDVTFLLNDTTRQIVNTVVDLFELPDTIEIKFMQNLGGQYAISETYKLYFDSAEHEVIDYIATTISGEVFSIFKCRPSIQGLKNRIKSIELQIRQFINTDDCSKITNVTVKTGKFYFSSEDHTCKFQGATEIRSLVFGNDAVRIATRIYKKI